MKKDPIDKLIDDAAQRLAKPVNVPRDRMWERIESMRAEQRNNTDSSDAPVEHPQNWTAVAARWWPAAAVVLLALGFGLGRIQNLSHSIKTPEVAVVIEEQPTPPTATDRMLLRAEALLASFDQQSTRSPMADPIPRWAGLLLDETRLLMDSPAVNDPDLASLLIDLELVLAQITQLQNRHQPEAQDAEYTVQDQRAWIADGLAKRATLQRLRNQLDTIVVPQQNAL